MERLISWCRRVVCRGRPVGDEIYDDALDLARRQRGLREIQPAAPRGKWL